MTSSKIRTVALVALVVLGGLVTGVTAVAAQDAQDATNETTGEDEQQQNDGPHTSAFDLDEDVRITSVDWYEENETMHVGVHNRGDDRATVYVAQVIEKGSESWGFVTLHLRPDESTTVTLEGIEKDHGEEVAMVASEQSMSNEKVEWLSTGPEETTVVSLFQGVVIGIVILGGMTFAMAWRRENKPGKAPEDGMTDSTGWF